MSLVTGDQSPASQDRQAPPSTSCLVQPPHPTPTCPPASTAAPGGSSRSVSPCSDLGRPLSTDTRDHTHLSNLANPPGPGERFSTRGPQTTPPAQQSPPLCTCPSGNWSPLHQDQPDLADPSVPPLRTKRSSAQSPAGWARRSPPPGQEVGTAQERWGGAQEELSDLDWLYRASLRAPSMHRGRGQATPPRAGETREEDLTPLTQVMSVCVCVGLRRTLSGSARSNTPTAEMERWASRTPLDLPQVSQVHLGCRLRPEKLNDQPSFQPGEDENNSAENLRRLARRLSRRALGHAHTQVRPLPWVGVCGPAPFVGVDLSPLLCSHLLPVTWAPPTSWTTQRPSPPCLLHAC